MARDALGQHCLDPHCREPGKRLPNAVAVEERLPGLHLLRIVRLVQLLAEALMLVPGPLAEPVVKRTSSARLKQRRCLHQALQKDIQVAQVAGGLGTLLEPLQPFLQARHLDGSQHGFADGPAAAQVDAVLMQELGVDAGLNAGLQGANPPIEMVEPPLEALGPTALLHRFRNRRPTQEEPMAGLLRGQAHQPLGSMPFQGPPGLALRRWVWNSPPELGQDMTSTTTGGMAWTAPRF